MQRESHIGFDSDGLGVGVIMRGGRVRWMLDGGRRTTGAGAGAEAKTDDQVAPHVRSGIHAWADRVHVLIRVQRYLSVCVRCVRVLRVYG